MRVRRRQRLQLGDRDQRRHRRVLGVATGSGLDGPEASRERQLRVVADSSSDEATRSTRRMTRSSTLFQLQYGSGPSVTIASAGNVFYRQPVWLQSHGDQAFGLVGDAYWYMCNTNGPYYFSELSAFAVSATTLVASRSGAITRPRRRHRSLTELLTTAAP